MPDTLNCAGESMFSAERWQVLGGPALEIYQTMLSGLCPGSIPNSCPSQHSRGSISHVPNYGQSEPVVGMLLGQRAGLLSNRKKKSIPPLQGRADQMQSPWVQRALESAVPHRTQEKGTPGQISQGGLHRTLAPLFLQVCGLGTDPIFPN